MPLIKQKKDPKSLTSSKFGKILFIFIFSRFYALISTPQFYSEVANYYKNYLDINNLLKLPYYDFTFHESIISALLLFLPHILNIDLLSFQSYNIYFSLMMLSIDIIVIYILINFAKNNLNFNQNQLNSLLLYYSIFGGFFFFMIYNNNSLIMSLILVILMLVIINKNKLTKLQISAIAISLITKVTTILFIPLIALKQALNNKTNKEITISFFIKLTSYFSAILILFFFIDILIGDKYLSNIFYQNNYLNIESIYSSVIYILIKYNIVNYDFSFQDGQYFLVSSQFIGFFSTLFCSTILLKYYIFLSFFIIKAKNFSLSKKSDNKLLVEILLVTSLVTIIFLKGFNSKYLIWIIPIISLIFSYNKDKLQKIFFTIIFLLSSYIYLFGYFNILTFRDFDVLILLIRNFLLIFIVTNMVISLYKKIHYGSRS
ncbi:hypothetical protein N9R48_01800 [Rickettsiales bacterium]|nr:hypothetical protein [Rickettsiales bacterium]